MDELLQLSHQEKCVNSAVDEMRKIGGLTFDQLEMVRRYMNYVYSIGYYKGIKYDHRMRAVLQIYKGEVIRRFESIKDAAAAVETTPQSIDKVVRGVNNVCCGFFWKYADPPPKKKSGKRKTRTSINQ